MFYLYYYTNFPYLLLAKKTENYNLNQVIKSFEQKVDNLELIIKQMDTEKNKLAEVRVRNEFFSEFEGLVREKIYFFSL